MLEIEQPGVAIVSGADDPDCSPCLSLALGAACRLKREVNPALCADPWIVLFNSLGRQIAQNDDAGHRTDARVTARTQAGTCLIGLRQVGEQTGFVWLLTERYVKAP